MNYFASIVRRALLLLLGASVCISLAVAQDDSGSGTSGAVPAATAPAEQNNVENPPLSGLDHRRLNQRLEAVAISCRGYK